MSQRRNHFRVEYLPSRRPTLTIDGSKFPVLNLSEGGLSFDPERSSLFAVGKPIKGSVTFSDGSTSIVVGTVLRIQGNTIALSLTQGISFAKMLSEEKTLLSAKKTG